MRAIINYNVNILNAARIGKAPYTQFSGVSWWWPVCLFVVCVCLSVFLKYGCKFRSGHTVEQCYAVSHAVSWQRRWWWSQSFASVRPVCASMWESLGYTATRVMMSRIAGFAFTAFFNRSLYMSICYIYIYAHILCAGWIPAQHTHTHIEHISAESSRVAQLDEATTSTTGCCWCFAVWLWVACGQRTARQRSKRASYARAHTQTSDTTLYLNETTTTPRYSWRCWDACFVDASRLWSVCVCACFVYISDPNKYIIYGGDQMITIAGYFMVIKTTSKQQIKKNRYLCFKFFSWFGFVAPPFKLLH